MLKRKKISIRIIIIMIIFMSVGYISMDWLRFYNKPAEIEFLESPFSPYMKVFVSFLSFLIVWLIGRDFVEKSDAKRLKAAFTFIFIADFLFLLKFNLLGIAIFSLCQILLIYRNGFGLVDFFRKREWVKYKKNLVIYSVIALLIGIISLCFLFRPILKGNSLFYAFIVYAIFLCLSFWTAWVSHLINKLSRLNTYMIAAGMTLFVLCDLTVGLNLALSAIEKTAKTEFVWMISSSLTWMFYTPALVFLALSGYNIQKTN